MFKALRIIILLLILASLASTLLIQQNISQDWSGTLDIRIIPVIADQSVSTQKYVESLKEKSFKNISQDWSGTLDIRIIPVIADQSASTQKYVESLKEKNFKHINQYLISQAKRFNTDLQYSLNIQLEESTTKIPPTLPGDNASHFDIILWSLKLRLWAWKNRLDDHKLSQIRLYVLYQSPIDSKPLPHSTGLQNGLIGLINARASISQRSLHNIIITHELLHILGASDKYNLNSGQPNSPIGYADPNASPLLPQRFTEIMARAKPISNDKFEVATHLRQTRINKFTAYEIGWLQSPPETQ